MELYKKPLIANKYSVSGIVPLASIVFGGPVIAINPLLQGLAVGAALMTALSKKGGNIIDSFHTSALAERKSFELT